MLGNPLHKVAGGRLFVRQAAVERGSLVKPVIVVGLVELPKAMDVERVHDVRLNDHLWMDTQNAKRPRMHDLSWLPEMELVNVLTDARFGRHILPDSFEMFVRRSFLKHEREGMQWALVAGLAPERLQAMPKDGLYEFSAAAPGFRLVSDNTFNGDALAQVFRRCLWGPGGQFGLTTTLEVQRYPTWVVEERKRNASRDEEFAVYMARMEERPAPMVYTEAERVERDQRSRAIIEELLAARRDAEERPRQRAG